MLRRGLIRMAVASAVVSAAAINAASAQPAPPPITVPPPVVVTAMPTTVPPLVTSSHRNNAPWYALGGVLGAGVALGIKIQLFPDTGGTRTLPTRSFPAREPSLTQLPTLQLPGTGGGGAGGGGAAGAGGAVAAGGAAAGGTGAGRTGRTAKRTGFNPPPPGETRFEPNHILLDSTAAVDTLEAIARQHDMTREETVRFALTGRTMHRWRINGTTSVPDMT